MVSGEECSKLVSIKVAEDVARKEAVVESGTSKHKIRSFFRKRSGKECKLKSDQKNELVVLNQDSSEASAFDTSLPSESNNVVNCSSGIEMSYDDFVPFEQQAKSESEIVAQTVTDVSMLSTESLMEMVGVSGIFDDEEEAARSDRQIKRVLETRVYPTRSPKEIVSAEPTDASNPRNNVENIENVANKVSDRQVTSADLNTTLPEDEQHVFGVDCHDPVQEEFGVHEHESKEDNFFPDSNAFRDKIELMKKLTCNFVDFLFDIIDIESSHSLGKKAASAEVNNGKSYKKKAASAEVNNGKSYKSSSFFSGSLDEKVSFASGRLGEIGWNANNDNASLLNENCNGKFLRNDDTSNFGQKSIGNNNASLKKKVTATNRVHLLRDMPDTERHSCDLAEPDVVASSKRRNEESKNEAQGQTSATSLKKLFNETKIAIKMMIVEKDVNEEIQIGATTLEESRTFEKFDAVAEPLKGLQRNANSTSTFLESGMIRVLERNVVLSKEDGASIQSSLDFSYPDWESALSPVEEDSMIVHNFPDDEVSLCNENSPVVVEGLMDGIAFSKGRQSFPDLEEAHMKAVPLNITVAKRRVGP